MAKLIVSLGIILCLIGCLHTSTWETGKPIKGTQMQKIIKGETTSKEIISWFGAPSSISTGGQEELFIYKFCRNTATATRFNLTSKENCNELTVTFDKVTGKVKDYDYQKRIPD